MEELGEKAAELASKALDAIKAAFKRTPGSEHRPSEPSALGDVGPTLASTNRAVRAWALHPRGT